MRVPSVLLAAIALLALSACSGIPQARSTPTGEAASVDVAINQGRTDYSRGVFSISVTNSGDETITIDAADYSSPRFSEHAVIDHADETLGPGRTVDLRVPIPPLDCADAAKTADEVGTVTLRLADGEKLTNAPIDPNSTVDRLVHEGCLVHSVDAVVTITPPEHVTVTGTGAASVARIDLQLAPTGADGQVAFSKVRSTTLMSPVGGSDSWPLGFSIDADAAARTITLEVRPTRCDPHALADDKVGTILVIDVATSAGAAGGPATSGRYLLPLPPSAKADMYGFITAACGD